MCAHAHAHTEGKGMQICHLEEIQMDRQNSTLLTPYSTSHPQKKGAEKSNLGTWHHGRG